MNNINQTIDQNRSNKVLIITYYWPPAGGPGVQRWLKFVKYLPDFGIEPIVYIPKNPTYPIIDKNLESEVGGRVTILKQKIKEPYGWASVFSKKDAKNISSGIIPGKKTQSLIQKFLLWVRGNLFIPDARVLWVNPSVEFLKKYIDENKIETIITTGPPHSLHLIGLKLKTNLNIKWFADFRDPWTTIGYHKELKLTSKSQKKHLRLEREVLNSADVVIVTSQTTKKEFEKITSRPIYTITNGYDVENVGKVALDEKFTISHIGSFLSERNPRILWKVLKNIIKENPEFAHDFQMNLVGAVSQEVLNTIQEFKLNKYINILGYVSHKEAIVFQKKSQVLLLVEINSEQTKNIIPGKLYEYMSAERPIIGIGPEESDFENILIQTNTGIFHQYDEIEKLEQTILDYYNKYKTEGLKNYPVGLQQYSRKSLTQELAKLLR